MGSASPRRSFSCATAWLAIVGQDESRLELARKELGDEVVAIQADVRLREDMRRASQQIADTFGGVDVLFANAGVAFATPLASTDESKYDALMDVNLNGVYFPMQAISPILNEDASVILNTSWLNQVGTSGLSLLSASKAAVRSLARTWSSELLFRLSSRQPRYIAK